MTNHWIDYKNSDVFMNIGLNTAENHPVSMKWIEKARENGAKLICVDPRVTRTAAVSDIYAPIRPGTNTAFLSGLINYALENELYHEEYIRNYTNAAFIVKDGYDFEDGMFAAPEDATGLYYRTDDDGNPLIVNNLSTPECVLQKMKDHYSRYDLDTVSNITGCPKDKLEEVAKTFCGTGEPDRAGNIMYAMGITQFTHGAQNVRAIAVLQLLLGNMGRAGGGVNAQRGQSNVQGSTDMAMLFHIIPGYMSMVNDGAHPTYEDYLNAETPEAGYWVNTPKFFTSLLKAFWGENATPENDFCYDYFPKLEQGKDRSHIGMYNEMSKGNIKGMINWADNPAVSGPTAGDKRKYMANLDWLVNIDMYETESAAFWKAPGIDSSEVGTEVFLLPAAMHVERTGTVSNSGRWIQWKYKAVEPEGDSRSDLDIVDQLYKAVRNEYETNGGVFPEPILELNWGYGEPADPREVAKEINGYYTDTGELVENFTHLEDDGSTASGNWLYSGYYNDELDPPSERREKEKEGIGSNPNWSFCWPVNRRIIYNRCSADPEGYPWDPEKPVVWWENGEFMSNDVPDFGADAPPEESAKTPFIMLPEGRGRLFSLGVVDGFFPEHYEPWESPFKENPQANNSKEFNPHSTVWYPETRGDVEEYPYVATSYRVTEHYQTGMMTRNMPWLYEAMPEMFVEISVSLGNKIGVNSGDKVEVETKRGSFEAPVCVTERIKPYQVNGKELEVVGMLWHWGYQGGSKGPVANDITPSIGDANTTIPEYKAFLCNIRKVN